MQNQGQKQQTTTEKVQTYPFELPPLEYGYDALEPFIDQATMRLHHDKHHQAYVDNLNKAVADYPELKSKSVEELLRDLSAVPESIRAAVRNNAGGHANHTMFWKLMKPNGGGEPAGEIADAIKQSFGGFDEFKTKFSEAGVKQFGSGWVWLVRGNAGKLLIASTPNQDTPLMQEGALPVLGNDVWEHAYYLKYQNKRPDYLAAWWNTVDWQEVNRRFLGSVA